MKLKNILLKIKRNLGKKVKTELKFISELEPDIGHQNFQIDTFGNSILTAVYVMYSPLHAGVLSVGYQESCNLRSVCFH